MHQKRNVLLIHANTGMITERAYDFVYTAYEGAEFGYALQ